jgi:hypothetical protein
VDGALLRVRRTLQPLALQVGRGDGGCCGGDAQAALAAGDVEGEGPQGRHVARHRVEGHLHSSPAAVRDVTKQEGAAQEGRLLRERVFGPQSATKRGASHTASCTTSFVCEALSTTQIEAPAPNSSHPGSVGAPEAVRQGNECPHPPRARVPDASCCPPKLPP